MRNSPQMQTIFHVLLSYAGFLVTSRFLGILFAQRNVPLLTVPLAAWVTELASFLTAVLVFLFLYRRLAPDAVPRNTRIRCSVPMALVHVGYGCFWLMLVMGLVVLAFPVTEEAVRDGIVPRILTAVLVHPLLEEILFRRICQERLLSLSVVQAEREVVEEDAPMPPEEPTCTRAGMLFAILTQALLFALAHTGGGGMLYGFGGGVVLGVLMLRTGRLWVPVACHMLLNLRSVLWPYLPEGVTYGLDILLLVSGLLCGAVFWLHRYRESGRKRI